MNELVYLKNDQAITDSLSVATMFQKKHNSVLRAIENKIKNDSTQNCAQCFQKTKYKDDSGKWNTKYLMNRDGFTFLAMGFTGKKADEWKWKYIEAFNKMENIVRERNTESWLETRQQGKLIRREETDTIQKLVEYAKSQGSSHSNWLYRNYTDIANKMAGVTDRDTATFLQLTDLSTAERMIAKIVLNGMEEGKHYKEIFQECKERLETVKQWLVA